MSLTNSDVAELTDWRRALHRAPELSGAEAGTAKRVIAALEATGADAIVRGLGEHGVAAIYEGAEPGPTLLLRAETDALPIEETGTAPHRSAVPGVAHLCGHDGHSAILTGLARLLGRRRPARGRAVLLFQPAEETGAGMRAVLADPAFAPLRPDMALALHNMPGLPLGHVALAPGPFACASRGLRIALHGATAHAAQPETGRSPAPALSALLTGLASLGPAGAPMGAAFRLVTLTHARMGEPAFGIAPAEAELFATLRTRDDAPMEALAAEARALVAAQAEAHGLGCEIEEADIFAACHNAPEATALLDRAVTTAGLPRAHWDFPMRASEDFGLIGSLCPAAMLLLGAGEQAPALHNSDYDFPDDLIAPGVRIFEAVCREMLGPA